jgi:predicted small lipoprotein YifL
MRNASKSLALLIAVTALAACQRNEAEKNIAIDNDAATSTNIETLPADESSSTPSNELINGADSADVNASNAAGNTY